jgi:hypothetical protein
MAMLMSALLLLQQGLTKDDVLRLTKEGEKEEAILRKIGDARFALGTGDVVGLKKAGVGDRVIARMVAGPSELKLENLSHRGVGVAIQGNVITVGLGDQYPPGARADLAAAGEYTLQVPGRRSSTTLKTPATLTFRGCNLDKFEVVTLYIESPSGLDTCFVELNLKPQPEPEFVPAGAPPPIGTRPLLRVGLLERLMDLVGSLASVF